MCWTPVLRHIHACMHDGMLATVIAATCHSTLVRVFRRRRVRRDARRISSAPTEHTRGLSTQQIRGHHERQPLSHCSSTENTQPRTQSICSRRRVVCSTAPGGVRRCAQGTTKILKTWQPAESVDAYLWELLQWANVDLDQPLNKGSNEYVPTPTPLRLSKGQMAGKAQRPRY
jgi:hypothetical protein